jgi:guanine deaminase
MSTSSPNVAFMEHAIALASANVRCGKGGPFATVVVKDGAVIAEGVNQVTATNDPTAHSEVIAIRNACRTLNSFQLHACEVYSSCEPCPMCLGAIYWARPAVVYYANTSADAAAAGFDDSFIYRQIATPISERSIAMIRLPLGSAAANFDAWREAAGKTAY